MSWLRLSKNEFQWKCDWLDCDSMVENSGREGIFTDRVSEVMPYDWSGMLITSMGDGDYQAVLCTAHADSIKRMVFDRMRPHNNQVVGY